MLRALLFALAALASVICAGQHRAKGPSSGLIYLQVAPSVATARTSYLKALSDCLIATPTQGSDLKGRWMLETDLGATNLTDYGCPSLTAEHARYAREIKATVAHLLAALPLAHYTLTTTDAVQCGVVPITPLLMSKGYKDTWLNHRTIRIGGLMRAGLKNSGPTHRGLTKRGKMRGSSPLSQCPNAAEVLQLANGSYVNASAVPDTLTVAVNTNVPAYGVFHALKITASE